MFISVCNKYGKSYFLFIKKYYGLYGNYNKILMFDWFFVLDNKN